jgi:hypothetical protein
MEGGFFLSALSTVIKDGVIYFGSTDGNRYAVKVE